MTKIDHSRPITRLATTPSTQVKPAVGEPSVDLSVMRHYFFSDHAFLRYFWSNFAEVASGVYRSNQPTRARLKRMAHNQRLQAVLSLRGGKRNPPGIILAENARVAGLELYTYGLHARRAQEPERYLGLIELFRELPKPFLFHCKSGADRSGIAAAFYLIAIEGQPIKVARKQLHWRFIHLRNSSTGILDAILDSYEAAFKKSQIGLEDWLKTGYDPEIITQEFANKRGSGRRFAPKS